MALAYSQSGSCRSANLGWRDVDASTGCNRDNAGVAASIMIAHNETEEAGGEGDKDFGSVVVLFHGDDCKPSDILTYGDDGCLTGNYGSYEVWDLWSVDGMEAPELK